MGKDSETVMNIRRRGREASAPAPSAEKSPPDSNPALAGPDPRPGFRFALPPGLNPLRPATRDGRVTTKPAFLASLHFCRLFLGREPGLGAGVVARFAKAPVGISACLGETKGVSAKKGPPVPMEKPAPRGFAKLGAAPRPGEALELLEPFLFFEK